MKNGEMPGIKKIFLSHAIMFPGHMTAGGSVLYSHLAGLVGRPDMNDCWQNNEGVTGRPTGPPGRPGRSFDGFLARSKGSRGGA